jgi:hypothetical protein
MPNGPPVLLLFAASRAEVWKSHGGIARVSGHMNLGLTLRASLRIVPNRGFIPRPTYSKRYLATRILPLLGSRMSEVKPLYTGAENPLVWVDCEMSGLDPRRNRLLEIAVSD